VRDDLEAHPEPVADHIALLEVAVQGPAYESQDLVFCRENGTPIWPRTFSRFFDHHVRDAGLPKIRSHDLRHTHTTLALEAGVHPKIVQERLGHATIAITLDTYSPDPGPPGGRGGEDRSAARGLGLQFGLQRRRAAGGKPHSQPV
jgi:integrase